MGPIVLTLVVRDECDVVAACVPYHLARGVDLVLVTDHRSRDGTRDLLRAWERTGAVRWWREDGLAFRQDEWVTRMARRAAIEHRASWCIHGDADEFWWPHAPSLREALSAVRRDVDALAVPRTNHLPVRGEHGPFWDRMVWRDTRSVNPLGSPLPPKVCHRACPEVRVGFGNHAVASPRLRSAASGAPHAVVHHFPVRSREQARRKFLDGAAAAKANAAIPEALCCTWRMLAAQGVHGIDAWYDDQVELGERGREARVVRDERVRGALRALGGRVPARRRSPGPGRPPGAGPAPEL